MAAVRAFLLKDLLGMSKRAETSPLFDEERCSHSGGKGTLVEAVIISWMDCHSSKMGVECFTAG